MLPDLFKPPLNLKGELFEITHNIRAASEIIELEVEIFYKLGEMGDTLLLIRGQGFTVVEKLLKLGEFLA
jgi:hypothetical protein